MGRVGAAAAPLLVAALLLVSDSQAGRVIFPGPSIGPVPPSLWQSLHSLRQARRLDGRADDGAPELRAAGVRIGQKYSDLKELPQLPQLPPQQQRDGGLQPLQGGDLEQLQPLEPLDIQEQLEIRGHPDFQQADDPLPPRVNDVDHQQNSEALQSLGPLPFFLAAEPRGAELSSEVEAVNSDPRGFNSLSDRQRTNDFVSFGDGQPGSDPRSNGFSEPHAQDVISSNGFSEPHAEDIIPLDDTSETALVTGQIPEGVVYVTPAVEDGHFNEELPGELRLPSREAPRPHRQDLQSSASVLDPTSVVRPETHPPFHRPLPRRDQVQPRQTTVAVAEGPLRSDQNLLNLLVTQGVLRPVGRVRVARLRLVTDAEKKREEEAERRVFFSPAQPEESEVIVKVSGDPSEVVLDERRRYREGTFEVAPSELGDESEDAAQDEYEDGLQTLTNDEREQVLNSNIVPILSEEDFFDRLVTPRASSSSNIAATASDTVPSTASVAGEETTEEAGEEPELLAKDTEDQQTAVVTSRAASLAARLTEIGSRVSRQGVWGRRLASAPPTLRRQTGAAESGREDGRQNGWQRRIDVGEEDAAEPVLVESGVIDAAQDLDSERSERHEEVAVLEADAGERDDDVAVLQEEQTKHEDAVVEVDVEGDVHWEAAAPGTTQSARTDILTEHTANFHTDSSIEEDEEAGSPQLVAEIHNCPELGGSVTLECRVKNAPQHDEIKRFWWMRRHFDGEYRAVRDELLAVNGVSQHTTDNISVQQVTATHQRLVVTAVAAADTGLYMCQAGWGETLQEVEMLVFLCH